jgi:hypothetical protein
LATAPALEAAIVTACDFACFFICCVPVYCVLHNRNVTNIRL